MEIIRFKKGKKNIYELEFDNSLKLKLYDDVIVKYNLLANKIVDDTLLEEITDYNDSLKAYYDSLNKISYKMRSEREIKDYLTKQSYSDDIIKNTINKLKKDGYLNRELYIKSYINDMYNFNNYGPLKIKNNLNKLGFSNEEIEPYLELDFKEKALKLIDKKVKLNKKYNTYLLRQHLNNYLINLGYPKEIFEDYLDNINVNNKEYLKKEVLTLIRKYEKKYEKEQLIYFIKDKLYKKGYNSDEMKEVLNELL